MNKILIGIAALSLSVSSAATMTHSTTHSGMMISKRLTSAMCMKRGGMVKTVSGKKMCVGMKSSMMRSSAMMHKSTMMKK